MESLESSSDGEWSCMDVEEFDALSIDFKPAPKEKYPAKLHARSVVKHLGVKQGLIYLPGMPLRYLEDSDQPEVFRQRRYFYYLSGVDFPNCAITYDIQKDNLTLFIPPQNTGTSQIFNGTNPTKEECETKYDVDQVLLTSALNIQLNQFAHKEFGKIYVLNDSSTYKAKIAQTITFKDGRQSNLVVSPIDSTKLKTAMNNARVVKSAHEIKLLRKANDVSAKAHTNVLASIKYLENEAEIEAIFIATSIGEQAKQQAYGVIAASGKNSSTLHYMANNESLKGRQLVCLDAGAEWNCYASDVTRTFPISGEYSTEAREVYDIVAEMQESCIEMLEPGVNFRSVHVHAVKIATLGLMDLGILRGGDFDEIFTSGVTTAFFMHGLGHHVGLEVHDVERSADGDFVCNSLYEMTEESWPRNFHEMLKDPSASIVKLSAGMVITIEPGIYFSRYAIGLFLRNPRYAKYINQDLLEEYYDVGGVRIEDNVLITDDGYENITTAPKGDEALKIINASQDDGEVESRAPRKRGWFW